MSPSNKKQSKSKLAKCATSTVTSSLPPLSTDSPLTGADYTDSFATFISLANLSDIKYFFEAAGSSRESINLKVLWGRAFAEGRKVGNEEEYSRGFNAGFNEGYSEACEKDYEAGLTANTIVSTMEIGTQVDLSPSRTPCIISQYRLPLMLPSNTLCSIVMPRYKHLLTSF
jgi:hypothetical protein